MSVLNYSKVFFSNRRIVERFAHLCPKFQFHYTLSNFKHLTYAHFENKSYYQSDTLCTHCVLFHQNRFMTLMRTSNRHISRGNTKFNTHSAQSETLTIKQKTDRSDVEKINDPPTARLIHVIVLRMPSLFPSREHLFCSEFWVQEPPRSTWIHRLLDPGHRSQPDREIDRF